MNYYLLLSSVISLLSCVYCARAASVQDEFGSVSNVGWGMVFCIFLVGWPIYTLILLVYVFFSALGWAVRKIAESTVR